MNPCNPDITFLCLFTHKGTVTFQEVLKTSATILNTMDRIRERNYLFCRHLGGKKWIIHHIFPLIFLRLPLQCDSAAVNRTATLKTPTAASYKNLLLKVVALATIHQDLCINAALINGFGSSCRSSSGIIFFWHSDHTQPFRKRFNAAGIRRRDWLTPEVNNSLSVRFIAAGVHAASAAVPSALSCNCFPSSCEAREPTSRCVSLYPRVWII